MPSETQGDLSGMGASVPLSATPLRRASAATWLAEVTGFQQAAMARQRKSYGRRCLFRAGAQITFDALAGFGGQHRPRGRFVTLQSGFSRRRVQETDLPAVSAAPAAEESVNTKSEPLEGGERTVKRKRLQPGGLLAAG